MEIEKFWWKLKNSKSLLKKYGGKIGIFEKFDGKTSSQNCKIWIEKTGREFENFKNLIKKNLVANCKIWKI